MRKEVVEIYSDACNAAIMRHPARHFPGVLIQGDSLGILHSSLSEVLQNSRERLDEDDLIELEGVVERLGSLLAHYNHTMTQHGITGQ